MSLWVAPLARKKKIQIKQEEEETTDFRTLDLLNPKDYQNRVLFLFLYIFHYIFLLYIFLRFFIKSDENLIKVKTNENSSMRD